MLVFSPIPLISAPITPLLSSCGSHSSRNCTTTIWRLMPYTMGGSDPVIKPTGNTLRGYPRKRSGDLASPIYGLGRYSSCQRFRFLFRDRKMRLLMVILGLTLVGIFSVVWSNSHYAAPLICVVYGLMVQAIRYLRVLR